MSKCFGNAENYKSKRYAKPEPVCELEPDRYDIMQEEYRQRQEMWDTDFVSLDQYVRAKLRMLRKDMYIDVPNKDVAHLRSLKTKAAIDAAVHSIIDRAWDDD